MKTIYKKLLLLLLLLPFGMLAQSVFTGSVVDRTTGLPIPGVNVQVSGTSSGTATDFDGSFKLSNVKTGARVNFSFVGYENVSITFSGQTNLTVQIEESSAKLSEIVIQVGYGTAKKKDLTGSTTTITAKEFNKGANVTTENLLNGRVAGLTVNTSGAPGSGSTIRIRGGSSLFASNDPLIVIDGLPIENNSGAGSTSILAGLNPATVESITVLKDASATAIYGVRASNGVIIINTKKGGKTLSVDYNVQYGKGNIVKTIETYDADGFRALINSKQPLKANLLGNANTNWQRAIYQKTDFIDNNLSIRGNLLKVIPARLTIGKTYQEGLRLTNSFNRNTVGVALNPSFLDGYLKLKLNANYANENNRFADGVEGTAIRFDPTQPVYQAGSTYQGFFEYVDAPNTSGTPLQANTPRNPVAQLLQTMDTGRNNRLFGNFELDYKFHFLPSVRAVVNLGFDESFGERSLFRQPKVVASGSSNNNLPYGNNQFTQTLRRSKLIDAYLVYNKKVGELDVEVTGGYSYQKFEGRNFNTGNVYDPNFVTNPAAYNVTQLPTDNILLSYFGRTNLSYKDKYLLTLAVRQDNTSKFSKENRTGYFPAASFAWKLKEEFFTNNKSISDLKLRVGYGITGQQDIPAANAYLQKYNVGQANSQYIFGTSPIPIAISERFSPGITWEETETYNAGLDYGLFNNRINGTIDVFYKDSKNLLVDAAVSDGSNFSNRAFQNVGNFTTKGIEFAINADIVKSEKFNWSINFNATKFERRIENLIYDSDIQVGDGFTGTGGSGQVFRESFTPFSFLLYKQLYNNAGEPIEGAFADLNGDNIINDKDRYIYKNPDPDATFGFASNINYGNLDFSFNLRASVGNRILNAVNASRAQYNNLIIDSALSNIPTSVADYNFNTTANVILSDIFVENGSFLRMDNITLGYTIPNWLEGKASLRFFTGLQNAFIITKYSGLDPEIGNNGVDNTIYPRQRQLLFGANVKF